MKVKAIGGSPRRFAIALLTTATAATVLAPIAASDSGKVTGPDGNTGWTLNTDSQTYVGDGDLVTSCPGATPNDGFGGTCFKVVPGATYVTAALTDQASSEVAGNISFQGAGGVSSGNIKTVDFCGATPAPIKIPAGTATIFITPYSAVGNKVESKAKCAQTDTGTTGTATLTSYTPPPVNTGTGSSGSTGVPAPQSQSLRSVRVTRVHAAHVRASHHRALHRAARIG